MSGGCFVRRRLAVRLALAAIVGWVALVDSAEACRYCRPGVVRCRPPVYCFPPPVPCGPVCGPVVVPVVPPPCVVPAPVCYPGVFPPAAAWGYGPRYMARPGWYW